MPPALIVEEKGDLTILTLNRPEARNAVNLETLRLLVEALERSHTSPGRVVVLTGAGGAFCSGGDIQEMVSRRGQAVATFERLREGLSRLVRLIVEHPKPVLARVDGDAVGAGLGLALACDALLATRASRFGCPFVKVGLVPDTGTSWLLPHIVGVQQARRLLLTGELIDATEAEALGLVSQLVDDASALDAATADWTRRLIALPATALRDAKRELWQNLHLTLGTATLNEALLQGVRFTTDEHAKAVDAFLAKRKG